MQDIGTILPSTSRKRLIRTRTTSRVLAEIYRMESEIIDVHHDLWDIIPKLFDDQISLMSRWVPNKILNKFKSQRQKVIDLAYENPLEFTMKPYISFLPVIPFSVISAEEQLKQVKFSHDSGSELIVKSYLESGRIKNLIRGIPRNPYYIFAVRDGSGTENKSFKDIHKFLNRIELKRMEVKIVNRVVEKDKKRKEWHPHIRQSGLIVPELISFAIFSEAMNECQGMWAFASGYRTEWSQPFAPMLCSPGPNFLTLQSVPTSNTSSKWITPSCSPARRDFNQ